MAKKRKLPAGVVVKNDRWYVRIRYREGGKRRAAWRECAKNATDAKDVRQALKRELEESGPTALQNANMTWLELSKHFREHYLLPAKFVDDRLVSGYRSIAPVKVSLKALDKFFDKKPIRGITRGDLLTFKRVRLETPVVKEKWQGDEKRKRAFKIELQSQRAISSVNKELRLARHLFNIALDEGWLHKNPFKRCDRLISAADENECQRVLAPVEEAMLLGLCVGRRAHLRPRLICAIDSGMRWGEMIRTTVGDIDFDSSVITVQRRHTKRLVKRRLKMTPRVVAELLPLCEGKQPFERVFKYDSVKTAWTGLREAVGLTDVRWHDLRHTNATRIEKSKRVSAGQLQRHLGHADRRSTERYVNQDEAAVVDIAEALAQAAPAEAEEATH